MKWFSLMVVLSVAWYTVNIARIAWREGNRGGAVAVGILVLGTLVLPLWTLFFGT